MSQLPFPIVILIVILALWTVIWKIYAAWIACKNDHKRWFVALILLNTAGLLEIFYVLKIVKKSWAEVKMDFRNAVSRKK